MFTKFIYLDTNQIQFEVQNISKEIIPLKNRFVDPIAKISFIYVPGGCFNMEDTFVDKNKKKSVHNVHLYGYFIMINPVTRKEWEFVINNNSSYTERYQEVKYKCVTSYNDAQSFIHKLNNMSQVKTYRLPTEAEWLYAKRNAGKTEKLPVVNNYNSLLRWNLLGNNSNKKNPYYEWCEDMFQSNSYKRLIVHSGLNGYSNHDAFRLVCSTRSVIMYESKKQKRNRLWHLDI